MQCFFAHDQCFWSISITIQVQKQLQMRIEAQGKYLQKIIEEHQKLGSNLGASETLLLSKDNQDLSQSEPSGDASSGTFSPLKKQRIDECSKDEFTASQVQTKTAQRTDSVAGQIDQDHYDDNAGLRFDLEREFKKDEGKKEQ